MTARPRVFVLGAGRAGRGLARALRASGIAVVGVHGRREPGGEDGVSVGTLPPPLRDATIALVTVRDQQLEAALAELHAAPLAPGAVVLHASGSAEPDLAALRDAGHPAGTFHPLLPLAEPARAPELLRGAWIGIDGDAAAQAAARVLAAAVGARTVEIPPGAKARYHAAAVFASNFPVALLALATRLLESCGIPAAAADGAARSLFFAAVENLRHEGAAAALTGPVARGDAATVRRHRAALAGDAELLAAYDALSRSALRLAAERGLEPARLEEVRAALEPGAGVDARSDG